MIYNIFQSLENDRSQIGIISSSEPIEKICQAWIKYYFVQNAVLNIDYVDNDQVFIIWFEETEDDEMAEASYIEISKAHNQNQNNFRTILGQNLFYTLENHKIHKDMDQYDRFIGAYKLAKYLEK